ncbi:MAG TPA: FtsW/RodA/SpoVE family cell cycle protein, partial [Fimbriimonas sp.]|nr:FtsW/RodA/SpoVE family cell cycle protein [Fimbriimonas sp.]
AGTGWLKGEMKRRVPFQSTDFIFSLIGEEFGFMGCSAVLLLYGLLFYRIWMGMLSAADLYYQLVMAGILTVLAFHTIVNIAMVLGMAPVVGLWCPFLSYGGTAIWLCMSLIGLALNIRLRERVVLF